MVASKHKRWRCPYCGSPSLMRHGEFLSPKQAEIFDVIEKHGANGVMPEVLRNAIYPGVPTPKAYDRIRATIYQINCKLAGVGLFVRMGGRYAPYRVVRQTRAEVA